MSTLNINTTALATLNSVKINLYKESSPLTIINSQTFAAPHAERVISFYNLEPSQNYRYRWLEIDGSGNTIQQYASQSFTTPSSGSIEIKDAEYLQVGITPGLTAGASTATFTSWIGWKPIIEYRGFGTLRPIEDYTYNITTGLLTMLIAPFEANGLYSVIFHPKIIIDPLPATANLFNFIRYITADATIDIDDFGKRLIQVDGAGSTVILTLPAITSVTENKILIIKSGRGSHKSVTILSSSNNIDFLQGARTKIYMGIQEVIKIYRQNKSGVNTWQVLDTVGNFFTSGQFVSEYGIGYNKLPMLGTASYSSLEYPRIYEYIENLNPSYVVGYDVWFADKRRFSLKNASNLFHIPDLTDLYERVATIPGSYQEMMMLDHKHESTIGTLPTTLFGVGFTNRVKGNYSRIETGQTDLTSSPINTDGTVMSFNGNEIRPKTYTTLKYVIV